MFQQAKEWIAINGETWQEQQAPTKTQLRKKHHLSILNLREQARINIGIQDVFGSLYQKLGFHTLLSGNHAQTLKQVIFARLLEPGSKRKLSLSSGRKFGQSLPLDRIYRMMDALNEQESEIQKKVFQATQSACGGKVSLLLFDVTTLSFETVSEDEIRAFGFSKDHQFNTTQVVLALATTPEGLPIGYQLFSGNTAETKTLIASIEQWKQHLPIEDITVIGDRAMMSSKNIELLESHGFNYVVACPMKRLSRSTKALILDSEGYESTDDSVLKFKIVELSKGQRLIVSYCPKRAAKDKKDRERLVTKLKKKLTNSKRPKQLINNKGYLKFVAISGQAVARIDEDKIAQDAKWDGLHGVVTNIKNQSQVIYQKYKRLWVIEESFRINKHTLKMRPIYHFTAERIKTHVAICYMIFALIRHAQFYLQQQGHQFSAQRIIDALRDVEASVYKDITNDYCYKVMSAFNEDAEVLSDTILKNLLK